MKQFNLKVDETDWEQFEIWAKIQGSNPTEQLRVFISSIAADEIPDNYKEQIDQQIHNTLTNYVQEELLIKLSELVSKRLTAPDIDRVDTFKRKSDIDNIVYIDAPGNIDYIDNIDKAVTDRQSKIASGKSDRSIIPEKTESDRPIEARLNHRTYKDSEVAAKENLSTPTISRYRTGKRQPKDRTFWSRWAICSYNSSSWEAITT